VTEKGPPEGPALLGAGIPNAPSGGWRTATVAGVRRPIQRSVQLRLDVRDRVEHVPGQHYVVRLTAEDGYTAQRSYSVASPPGDPLVELFIERLDDGEVSTFLADVVEPGDELDVRGPIGGWFVWDGETPALLLAGGYGVVPFVAMLRHARHLGRLDLLRIAVSSRTMAELPYADEVLEAGALVVLTREAHGIRPAGRLTAGELVPLWEPGQTAYVCGSASFAESASRILVDLGIPPADIRVERFGPSGAPA
jgi:ferredoxin-NADP reductase